MKKNKLEDIIPIVRAQYVLRTLAKSTEMNLCVVDLLGNTIIAPTNDTCFCKEIRKDQKNKQTCLWCATHAALEAAQKRRPFYYKCPFGLVDFAVPIFYHDDVLGAIFGGELKIDDSDEYLDFCYPRIPVDDDLKKHYDDIEPSHFEKVKYTSRLLSQIVDGLENFTILVNAPVSSLTREEHMKKIKPALDYIDINYNKHFTLEDLAKMCCVSEPYMSRLFKSTMKCSLSQYITTMRIEKAKDLLADPTQKMLAIAYEVGYCDCAHFSKKFKRETGMTPSEYRTMISK